MKYAIIKIGAKQYKISEGDELLIEKIEGAENKPLTFDEVLLVVDGERREVGQPQVKKVVVTGKIIAQTQGKKLRVATYKAKSRYRRVKGHRQQLTKVLIQKIKNKANPVSKAKVK